MDALMENEKKNGEGRRRWSGNTIKRSVEASRTSMGPGRVSAVMEMGGSVAVVEVEVVVRPEAWDNMLRRVDMWARSGKYSARADAMRGKMPTVSTSTGTKWDEVGCAACERCHQTSLSRSYAA